MGHNDSNSFQPNVEFLNWFSRATLKFGELYHGYEVSGLENLPPSGGALLVFYHGLVPLDFWLLGMALYQFRGAPPCALVDRFLLNTPGLAWLTKSVGGVVGERGVALRLLREGVIVGVSPGGVKEAIAGTKSNYQLIWGQRKGFAELALAANVPIIPGFTENVEEMYRAPLAEHQVFQRLYEMTRLPLVPIVGLGPLPFPVKLKSHLGRPIHPQKGESATELSKRTQAALQELIRTHQTHGRSIWQAVKQRFTIGHRKPGSPR